MKQLFKRISWQSVATFTLFVLLATAMWYGHAMQSVRNTRVPVAIQYTGKPSAIGLGGDGLPQEVMIEVRDAGARLNTYHRDPLQLTIDLREYIHSDKGTILIPSDALRRKITNILQGTSRLIETHPEEISCPYFTEQEKSVSVVFAGEITPANGYQFAGPAALSHTRIRIFGDEKNLRTIDTVYTMPVTIKDISDTLRTILPIAVPKGIRAEYDSLTMEVIAERFTEKKFVLPIQVKGVPEGMHVRLFPGEAEVNVRMGVNHFAQVNASDIRVSCTYSSNRTDQMAVELKYTNPYITSAWVYPGVVEFIIEQ